MNSFTPVLNEYHTPCMVPKGSHTVFGSVPAQVLSPTVGTPAPSAKTGFSISAVLHRSLVVSGEQVGPQPRNRS